MARGKCDETKDGAHECLGENSRIPSTTSSVSRPPYEWRYSCCPPTLYLLATVVIRYSELLIYMMTAIITNSVKIE